MRTVGVIFIWLKIAKTAATAELTPIDKREKEIAPKSVCLLCVKANERSSLVFLLSHFLIMPQCIFRISSSTRVPLPDSIRLLAVWHARADDITRDRKKKLGASDKSWET